jgi:hypothetical protein
VAPPLRWWVVCVGEAVALAWVTVWVVEDEVLDVVLVDDVVIDDELDDVLDVVLEDVIDVDDAVELHVVEGVHVGVHCDQVLGDDALKLSVAVGTSGLRLKPPACDTGSDVIMTCPALVPLGATRITVSV